MKTVRRIAEEGVTLAELVVALAILAILMTGLSATLMNTLDLSRNNANRVVAANLAASAISELKTMPFGGLADLAEEDNQPTWTETVDGREFELTRRIEWSTNLADPGVCRGAIGEADENILRLTIEVRWNRQFSNVPVISETAVSPPISEGSSDSGTIAVFVGGAEMPPEGVPNVQVTLTGPAPSTVSETMPTDSDGCAVFHGLPRGDYEASLSRNGPNYPYIDLDQRLAPEVTGEIGTAPRIWANLEFRYTEAGALNVDVEGWADGAELPLATLPWYAENERDRSPYRFPEAGEPELLFPGLYDIGVGYCPEDEEVPHRGATVTVPTGSELTTQLEIGSFEVTWSDAVLNALADPTVEPRAVQLQAVPPPRECYAEVEPLEYTSITEGEPGRVFALLFGEGWTLEAVIDGEVVAAPSVALDVEDGPAVPEVELDYVIATDPDPGDPDPGDPDPGDPDPGDPDPSPEVCDAEPVVFDEPGTFDVEVPAGCTGAIVEAWGGGGGGSARSGGHSGAGGGGGGYARRAVPSVSAGDTLSAAVGSGGQPSQGGGESNVTGAAQTLVRAIGGSGASGSTRGIGGAEVDGGVPWTSYSGGDGGSGASPFFLAPGGGGGGGSATTETSGGSGQAGTLASAGAGGSGEGVGGSGGSRNNPGSAGSAPGGGGGGAGGNNSNAGSGAPGRVVITWTD